LISGDEAVRELLELYGFEEDDDESRLCGKEIRNVFPKTRIYDEFGVGSVS